ncbi:MAG: chemotaxis-specific protein-glutamate methyltransferase CheB [Magnetococcales bacterium]|nr:chemotaxis-specific protein-glutamate methyltransferase CheB [Magnetococcales bacterium]
MSRPIKVMVVDDTITYRMIMKKVAETIPGVEVIDAASNGQVALDKLSRVVVDVVLLDVEMPVKDGLATLKEITARFPQVTVVMVSGTSRSNANIVMECLNAGALDFVTKPLESNISRAHDALRLDLEPILTVIGQKKSREAEVPPTPPAVAKPAAAPAVRVTASPTPTPAPVRAAAAPVDTGNRPQLLLIGSSTGGPAALSRVLTDLGRRLSIPALIVQHMPPVFTASLAAQLAKASGLTVSEARVGQPLVAGEVLLAPGGQHMALGNEDGKLVITLNDGPKVNECRPAVDVLFMSAAVHFNGPSLCVILTGMGRDGALGVQTMKRNRKSYCITQDKDSCVVYGMPRSVNELGLADETLPLDRIGHRIAELCS